MRRAGYFLRIWMLISVLVVLWAGIAQAQKPTDFVCPSPIYGKLLWSGDNAVCPKGFILLPGWRVRQDNARLVCARCPENCSFMEGRDGRLFCGKTDSGASPIAPARMGPAPRNDMDVRQVLESMGFRIIEKTTVGAMPGYWIEIVDDTRAAQFGFKAWRQERATERGTEVSSRALCWTEQQGDALIIWIDGRTIQNTDPGKLPPYVKLYYK